MMNKVYIFDRVFNVNEETYKDHVEATNRAKEQSLRNTFTMLQNSNGKVFVFEHGEVANARRKQDLTKTAYEILVQKMEKEVAQARGKPHRKKN